MPTGAQHNDSFETITPASFKRMLDGCFGLRSTDVKRVEQHPTRGGHIPHGRIERYLVGLRRRVKATDLADELQRRVVQLVISGLAVGLPQTLDVSAHGRALLLCVQPPNGSRLSCGRRARGRNWQWTTVRARHGTTNPIHLRTIGPPASSAC